MIAIETLGVLAGICTTVALLPQLIRLIKLKETKDISSYGYEVLTVGLALWFVYGLLNHDWPIMIANGISCLLTGCIVFLKFKYG